MVIRAVYRDGEIQPLGKLPAEWSDGESLEIRAVPKSSVESDTDDWINERGAYANYTGEIPPHVREELERRIAALHELGPMEFEPGEREEMEETLAEMDRLSREEMQRIMDGRS